MVGVKVAAGSREEQEGSLRLVSERGMQPGYLLTGCVQSGSIMAVFRGSLRRCLLAAQLKVKSESLLRLLACRRP